MAGLLKKWFGATATVVAKVSRPASKSLTARAVADYVQPEPDGLAELVPEMREDYQVQLIERVFKSYVKQIVVTVGTDAGNERAEALAESLTDTFTRKLNSMLESFAYGRVAYEKCWQYEDGLNVPDLRELPYAYTSMMLDEEGRFDGIALATKDKDDADITLDPRYAWWLAIDATPLEPHGRSRFIGALQTLWRRKRNTMRLLDKFERRFVLGGGIIRTPDTFDNPDGFNDPDIDASEAITSAANCLSSGDWLRLSNKRVPGKEGAEDGPYVIDVEKLEFEVRDGRPLLDIIQAYDGWQLLSIGFPPKTIMEGDAVGSFALVSQQMLFVLSVIEDWMSQAVESYQEYVIDKAVEENFHSGVELSANWTRLTERPDDLASELVKSWLTTPQLSPLLPMVDVSAIMEAVGIQLSQGAAEKMQAIVDAASKMNQPQPEPPVMMQSPFLRKLWDDDYLALDCGTGQGGFKPGNKCGLENGDSKTNLKRKRVKAPAVKRATKSELAKASAKRVDKRIQRYAEGVTEPELARKIGGKVLNDNEPADVLIHDAKGRVKHGIELKTMVDNGNSKITMKRSAMERKAAWEKKNRATMHTVVYDDHKVFNAKGEGKHDPSKRRIFYRRGYGSFRVGGLYEVKGGEAELRKLLDVPRSKLPKSAGGLK